MPLLPQPYPDEVIGSVIERGCYQTGMPMKRLAQSLFGASRSCISFLMASKLPTLARYVGLDAENLLLQHTMYPYAVAFIPKREQHRLRQKVLSLNSDECIGSLTRNVSHGVIYRRVCESCILHDLQEYGETYWRRAHLLPGIWTCSIHHMPLVESSIPLRNNVQTRTAANAANSFHAHATPMVTPAVAKELQSVAVAALTSQIVPRDDWPQLYKEMARDSGYGMTGGDIATRCLASDMLRYFGVDILAGAGCSIPIDARQPWPALMVRDSLPQNYAPAKHVFYHTFCAAMRGQARKDFGYRNPGMQPADTCAADEAAVWRINTFLKSHSSSTRRFTVREILEEVGVWQAVRHARDKYPLVQARIAEFRISNQSARQVGLRPYWRKRLKSRTKPTIVKKLSADEC